MNTFERSPARPTVTRPYAVDSPWFSGTAEVATFAIEELIATKTRALYQRRKGRDGLFDLWLAITQVSAVPSEIVECFAPYRPEGWSAALVLDNLRAKLADSRFTKDLETLVPVWPAEYTIESAGEIARRVIEATAQ